MIPFAEGVYGLICEDLKITSLARMFINNTWTYPPLSDLTCKNSTEPGLIFYTVPLDEQSQYLDILGGNVNNYVKFVQILNQKAINENKTYGIVLKYFNKI